MRVLQINAVYGIGSTGRIVEDIHNYLKNEGVDSYVFYGIKAFHDKKERNVRRIGNVFDHKLHALLRRITKKHGGFSVFATKRLCNKISAIDPDVVHLHNLHSNYINLKILLEYLRAKNIPVVITLHDCWFYTGYCMHYLRYGCDNWRNGCVNCKAIKSSLAEKFFAEKKRLFENADIAAVGVSKWIADDVEYSVLKNAKRIGYIYNWVDLEVFKPREAREKCEKALKTEKGRKIVLGVSQGWSQEKGLDDFIYLAENLSGYADVVLVGKHDDVACPDNLKFIDYTKDREELSELYSAADVFVNPSKMETFGLVTVEAMACGTPAVGYANTGTKELINEDCGRLVENGDKEKLLNAVKEVLSESKEKYSEKCRKYVVDNFSKTTQIKKYVETYKQMSDYENANK